MTDESKGPSAWALKKAAAILSELCHEEDFDEIAWIAEEFESAHAAGRLEGRAEGERVMWERCIEVAKRSTAAYVTEEWLHSIEPRAIRREPDADG
jgi:hypothetical protein